MMSAGHCDCACLGCQHFCSSSGSPAAGKDAHHTRLLLALDRSIQAACLARGIASCDGLESDGACEAGALHTLSAGFAIALAEVLDKPYGAYLGDRDALDAAHQALELLMLEVCQALVSKEKT